MIFFYLISVLDVAYTSSIDFGPRKKTVTKLMLGKGSQISLQLKNSGLVQLKFKKVIIINNETKI